MNKKYERADETSLSVRHPACGQPVLVLKLRMNKGTLSVYGICKACDKYVRLMVEAECSS